jgi:SNF2 family DNA or RNA helicase
MRRTVRLADERFWCNFGFHDPIKEDFKRIEGRRWHPEIKAWSVPGSLRAWHKLKELGFTMLEYGGGRELVTWLEAGCPVPPVEEVGYLLPFQQRGVSFLARRRRAILADQQGLGKTRQSIVWADDAARVVVVAPKVTFKGWEDELLVSHGVYPAVCPRWCGWRF